MIDYQTTIQHNWLNHPDYSLLWIAAREIVWIMFCKPSINAPQWIETQHRFLLLLILTGMFSIKCRNLHFKLLKSLFCKRSSLWNLRGTHISDQIYDGRYFDPSTRAAINAVWQLAEPASGTVKRHGHDGDMGSAMTCHDLSMKNNDNLWKLVKQWESQWISPASGCTQWRSMMMCSTSLSWNGFCSWLIGFTVSP